MDIAYEDIVKFELEITPGLAIKVFDLLKEDKNES